MPDRIRRVGTPKPAGKRSRHLYGPLGSPYWFRGPAQQDGEWIVIDALRGEFYEPLQDSRFDGTRLARIRSPQEAVDFVTRFGLLDLRPMGGRDGRIEHLMVKADGRVLVGSPLGLPGTRKTPLELKHLRMRYRGIEEAAAEMKFQIRRAADLLKAIRSTGAVRSEAIDRMFDPEWPREGRSEEEIIALICRALADDLTRQVDARVAFLPAWSRNDERPERPIRASIQPTDLRGMCFFDLADKLMRGERAEECEECQQPFMVTDGRQRFCGKECANRSRYRRWKLKHPDAGKQKSSAAEKRGGKYGKAKRTRRG